LLASLGFWGNLKKRNEEPLRGVRDLRQGGVQHNRCHAPVRGDKGNDRYAVPEPISTNAHCRIAMVYSRVIFLSLGLAWVLMPGLGTMGAAMTLLAAPSFLPLANTPAGAASRAKRHALAANFGWMSFIERPLDASMPEAIQGCGEVPVVSAKVSLSVMPCKDFFYGVRGLARSVREHCIERHRLNPEDTERICWFDLQALTLTIVPPR
jgi:hypothetical protein